MKAASAGPGSTTVIIPDGTPGESIGLILTALDTNDTPETVTVEVTANGVLLDDKPTIVFQ